MAKIDYKQMHIGCIKTTKEMLNKQLENIKETNECDYSIGLYNGIMLCYSMLTLKEPIFYRKEDNNG